MHLVSGWTERDCKIGARALLKQEREDGLANLSVEELVGALEVIPLHDFSSTFPFLH